MSSKRYQDKDLRARLRVVIAGGGVAALEALLALRALAGHRVEITLVSPEREFVYRPVTVAEAFDRGEARAYSLAGLLSDCGGGTLIWDSLVRVEPDHRTAVTALGERLAYDVLVIATGCQRRDSVPGALCFRDRRDVPALRRLLAEMLDGTLESVAFALPAERMWSLPLYELALMTAAHLREHDAAASVTVVTPEAEPLELFGPAAAEAVSPLLEARGIRMRTSSLPALVRGRALVLAGGAQLFVDRVITLPLPDGPRLAGLPSDEHGFIRVDAHGRVAGVEDVYAAGDVTAFGIKQGGLAAQQADAVAEAIAADLGLPVRPRTLRPVLRGLLITGGTPVYLRAEPQHLRWDSTVAIDATPAYRVRPDASFAAREALWWPPAKIAGRYLAPYLATARPAPLADQLLTDRTAVPWPPEPDADTEEALELSLLLAEMDARWGDFHSAVAALDAAEALHGTLPPEYEEKRRRWLREPP